MSTEGVKGAKQRPAIFREKKPTNDPNRVYSILKKDRFCPPAFGIPFQLKKDLMISVGAMNKIYWAHNTSIVTEECDYETRECKFTILSDNPLNDRDILYMSKESIKVFIDYTPECKNPLEEKVIVKKKKPKKKRKKEEVKVSENKKEEVKGNDNQKKPVIQDVEVLLSSPDPEELIASAIPPLMCPGSSEDGIDRGSNGPFAHKPTPHEHKERKKWGKVEPNTQVQINKDVIASVGEDGSVTFNTASTSSISSGVKKLLQGDLEANALNDLVNGRFDGLNGLIPGDRHYHYKMNFLNDTFEYRLAIQQSAKFRSKSLIHLYRYVREIYENKAMRWEDKKKLYYDLWAECSDDPEERPVNESYATAGDEARDKIVGFIQETVMKDENIKFSMREIAQLNVQGNRFLDRDPIFNPHNYSSEELQPHFEEARRN